MSTPAMCYVSLPNLVDFYYIYGWIVANVEEYEWRVNPDTRMCTGVFLDEASAVVLKLKFGL